MHKITGSHERHSARHGPTHNISSILHMFLGNMPCVGGTQGVIRGTPDDATSLMYEQGRQ
jgi:hypothetical protein